MEAAFGLSVLRGMGSNYYYSSAGQEFSGSWWVFGRILGKQYNLAIPDEHHSDMLVAWGWNGMESHQMPRAPIVLKEISNNPEDVEAALDVCELDYNAVVELCRLMTTKRWSVHPDLGIYMGRNSTLNSYLMCILGAVCGMLCVPGGNVIPGMVLPLGFHAEDRNPKTWRTMATDMSPVAAGSFPPAIMPEEILSVHDQRIRAVYVSACNPLRAYPDTTAYEKAFGELDLLVVNDIVMSETARLAHYVLPCRTFYESWVLRFFHGPIPKYFFRFVDPL